MGFRQGVGLRPLALSAWCHRGHVVQVGTAVEDVATTIDPCSYIE